MGCRTVGRARLSSARRELTVSHFGGPRRAEDRRALPLFATFLAVLFRGALAAVLFASLSCFCFGNAADKTRKPTHILFLTSDGFRTDYIEWYNPANLKKLIAEGVRIKHATNVFPTVTTPNMTSLVTGSYPKTTGIACNSQYMKEEDRIVEHPRENRAETIAETLHRAEPRMPFLIC